MNLIYRLSEWLKNLSGPKVQQGWGHAFVESKLILLKQSISDAHRFLRQIHLRSLATRKQLPWYMVLGAENVGKTTLLSVSGLDLVSTDNQPLQHINPTSHCHWFFGKEAVFLDVSGNLMLSENPENHTLYLWKKFVALLYRYSSSRPIDGIILCVDLLDFQHKSFEQRSLQLDILRHHIQTFEHNLPVYIIFTRCDRIQGFRDFFHILSAEERHQACGVTLPLIEQQNFSQQAELQLNAFLQRLNQQIIFRLQRERDEEKRALIKNFPLQLEAQKRNIIYLTNQLHSTKNAIRGIYFTSSQQEGTQNDALSELLDTFGFPQQSNTPALPPQKNPFFIHHTLKKIIFTEQKSVSYKRPNLPKFFSSPRFYPILSAIVLAALILMLPSYYYNKHAIQQAQILLSEYQAHPHETTTDPLILINTLKKSLDNVQAFSNPLTNIIFKQKTQLQQQLSQLYGQALTNQFIPAIKQSLETQLQSNIDEKSPELFSNFKLYLMLTDPSRFNGNFVSAQFKNYAQQKFAQQPENQGFFAQHLAASLHPGTAYFSADPQLVQAARDALSNLSPADLIYLSLQGQYAHNDIAQKDPALNHVTALYTAANFSNVYHHDIPKAVEQITRTDAWVLDPSAPSLATSLTPELITEVQHLYAQRYVDFWQTQLTTLTVPKFNDLPEAREFAATFNSNHSPLLQPLRTIENNLRPIANLPEGKKTADAVQQARRLLMNSDPKNPASKALTNFVGYLNAILAGNNTKTATLAAAQLRMRNNGRDALTALLFASQAAPAPINGWLNSLATQTWETMMRDAQNQLNAIWMTEVVPKYNTEILNRYPVFKEAQQETSIADFSRFFGPNGVIEKFFTQNLSPFVDTSALYWHWKDVNGLHLNIPQTTLEMLNRAYLIRRMYFADNQKFPSVKFTITPTDVGLISSGFILDIVGQNINYATDFRQTKTLTWPGNKQALASFSENQGVNNRVFFKEVGDWALFRLFSHAQLATSQNPQLYQLEFNGGGQQVVYELVTNNPINPFLPDIMTQFRCPGAL